MQPLEARPHFVYELIAADDSRLYVGCSAFPGQRIGQHSVKDWFGDVARIEADRYPTQREALDEERARIEKYQPSHNSVYTDRHDAGGWESRRRRMDEAHAAGDFCHDSSCKPCVARAHELGVTCKATGNCARCVTSPPWWSLMTAEQRRARDDWEPLWEAFLDHYPSYDEMCAFFDAHAPAFTPLERRRTA